MINAAPNTAFSKSKIVGVFFLFDAAKIVLFCPAFLDFKQQKEKNSENCYFSPYLLYIMCLMLVPSAYHKAVQREAS